MTLIAGESDIGPAPGPLQRRSHLDDTLALRNPGAIRQGVKSVLEPESSRLKTAAACALAAVVLATPPARADWEGITKTKIDPPPPAAEGVQEGKIYGKAGKLRLEMNGRMGKGAVIVDSKAKKMTMLMEDKKAFMVMDTDGPLAGRGPGMQLAASCAGEDTKGCLEAAGFKHAGSDKVNGQKATKWARDHETPRGPAHQELWTADGFKEFAVLKQVTKLAERTVTLEVEGLKKAPQPDALFEVPAGYQDLSEMMKKRMPGGPGGPGGMGGRPGMPPGGMPPTPPQGEKK